MYVCGFLELIRKSFESEVTEGEIISMVNEGHEQGVLDAREAEMIQNIFEMDDKKAGDIMIHRKNIIGIDGAQDLNAALAFMVEQRCRVFRFIWRTLIISSESCISRMR